MKKILLITIGFVLAIGFSFAQYDTYSLEEVKSEITKQEAAVSAANDALNVLIERRELLDNAGWKFGGGASITGSQSWFNNWADGGENTTSANVLASVFANWKQGRKTWDNSLKVEFGQFKSGAQPWRKGLDKIGLTSKYGYELKNNWYFATLFGLETQFTKGYQYLGIPNLVTGNEQRQFISNLFAPAKINLGVGFDYKPSDNFSLFISPLTARVFLIMDDGIARQGRYGNKIFDAAGNEIKAAYNANPASWDNTKFELGAMLKARYQRDITKGLNFSTDLELFSDYLNNPQNIDVVWGTYWTWALTDYLGLTYTTEVRYDHDIPITEFDEKGVVERVGPTTQFRQVLGAGLVYTF